MHEYRVLKMDSPELKKDKRIYIYLPKSYGISDKSYPVLYMHDGQNLFDDKTAFMGESWGIMDAYTEHPKLPELIIVGIDSDEDRANELVPYEFTGHDGKKAGGDADLYLKFITETLKPYIDLNYRTFKSPKNTGIMGSSFGGVNSTYAALVYGDYFTRFGCVSNAYYYGGFFNELKSLTKSSDLSSVKKFYMDAGTKETPNEAISKLYLDTNQEMYEILKEKIDESHLRYNVIEGAIHHETEWKKRFPDIIKYMFND
ncbi:Carbohydrate acetyl esterase/feruloyl esterase precursor [Candidatus Izimaplasma bacterium HR1]|jgi:predicted alpha/beta superfamily hydrolase|uniref:alpha/beta hydrolase n=1 Tax=Candidatus Izimoplasma sp. HR1 TaxID=1541959 RepID=UPI0004F63088|nr:Carbohydrate acetyl esterase/feruloyl esterase precursor [Candidatus Izimaplasma bacterium HR1]